MGICLQRVNHFSDFEVCSLSFIFRSLIMICPCVDFFGSILFGVSQFLKNQMGGGSYISSNAFQTHTLSPTSATLILILDLLLLTHRSLSFYSLIPSVFSLLVSWSKFYVCPQVRWFCPLSSLLLSPSSKFLKF